MRYNSNIEIVMWFDMRVKTNNNLITIIDRIERHMYLSETYQAIHLEVRYKNDMFLNFLKE